LVAHVLLAAAAVARAPLFPDQSLTLVILGRLAAFIVSLVLDLRRRVKFIREQQANQQQQQLWEQDQQCGAAGGGLGKAGSTKGINPTQQGVQRGRQDMSGALVHRRGGW
jgi:hypothetical protein